MLSLGSLTEEGMEVSGLTADTEKRGGRGRKEKEEEEETI